MLLTNLCSIYADFNQNVESSKKKSLEAKERIPEIQTLIAESESQTRLNQRSLIGAKSAASKALMDAEEARTTAEKASKVSHPYPLILHS
jgi:hypothetical protein